MTLIEKTILCRLQALGYCADCCENIVNKFSKEEREKDLLTLVIQLESFYRKKGVTDNVQPILQSVFTTATKQSTVQ